MNIIITAQEALDKGIWLEVCKVKGINEYALNEGLMDSSEEIDLTEEEAHKLELKL